jgi:3-phenylpropionate/cinnamic acid dioxygenase small subunit
MHEDRELWFEAQAFYTREAWLLDDRRFDDWLALFTEDIFYFMPLRANRSLEEQDRAVSQPGQLALFEDDLESLTLRVARLRTGRAWAEVPPSRTRHLVTNILIAPTERRSEYRARSAFLIYRNRLEHDEDFFIGSRDDILRRVDGELRIARRTVILDAAVLTMKTLSVFF